MSQNVVGVEVDRETVPQRRIFSHRHKGGTVRDRCRVGRCVRMGVCIRVQMLPFREHGPSSATPVVLLLHYFGGSHREWDGVVERLMDRHRVVAADMAGFGEAAALPGFTVADMATRVRELVESFAPAPVVLVGHSMSGKAAMVVAAEAPPNLRGLVLVAPSPLAGEPMSDADRAAMAIANTSRERAERFARAGFYHKPSDEDFEIAVADVLRSSDEAFHAWPEVGTRENWTGRVPALRVKSLLIVGEHDGAIAPELQRAQTLPLVEATGGRLEMIADAAHLLPYEKPRELAGLLGAFAAEVG